MKESVLNKIIESRKASIARDKQTIIHDLPENDADLAPTRSLAAAIRQQGLCLIAEVKSSSPSRGTIRPNISVAELVRIYELSGASALSILTEPDYFGGQWTYLRTAKDFSRLPVLCKDFIIDEFQLHMARANGADAVLLIAAVLDDLQLAKFIKVAHQLKMEVLTEAINREELDRVLLSKTDLIGINNRDLHTLKVDLTVSHSLLKGLRHDRPIVVESGVFTHQDAAKLEKQGADGILVGTALMESDDIAAKVKELLAKS